MLLLPCYISICVFILGEFVDEAPPPISLDSDFQRYCNIMIDRYKHQPIVPFDWPPRVGEDFFGKLALLKARDKDNTLETLQQKAWYMLRGEIDKIPEVTETKMIKVHHVLKPSKGGQSLRVLIDGPPGIGKTTLCRKLLNMWAKGELKYGQYNLVLYCPLRKYKVARANELQELLNCTYKCKEIIMVTEYLNKDHGEGLLIIFDGWDELSPELRQSSLATRIICREELYKCSVIVTSRSYASSSLLEFTTINRHIEVMGFSEEEIKTVVRGTLEKEPHLGEKLIKDLEMRDDVQSLCYIPLICSIIILVYRKTKGELPTTLTQLYENFILQTIRRHVKRKTAHNIEPKQLHNLHHLPSVLDKSFQELCEFAYINLIENNPKITFSSSQLTQFFKESVQEDYLGLITTFTLYDEESYQFLHFTIQEFLAAWWITKYIKTEKTEKMFADHYNDDHFQMCLRFVAGLTQLKHESYKEFFNVQHLKGKLQHTACRSMILFSSITYIKDISDLEYTYIDLSDISDIHLLHLLYESQNTTLCQLLSHNITMKSRSLSFDGTHFDMLCLCFFLNNSNVTWNCLILLNQFFTADVLTNNIRCKRLMMPMRLSFQDYDQTQIFDKETVLSSFYHSLEECVINMGDVKSTQDVLDVSLTLLQLTKLQSLKMLYIKFLNMDFNLIDRTLFFQIDTILSELEKSLQNNTKLQEIIVVVYVQNIMLSPPIPIINRMISGLTRNKSIQKFSLEWNHYPEEREYADDVKAFECLLKGDHTLYALQDTPLTDLIIPNYHYDQLPSLLQHIKGLHRLELRTPYPLPPIFDAHPNLQHLVISLETAEETIRLFNCLQINNTLKVLRVTSNSLLSDDISVFSSLQDMLTQNKTLEYLTIGGSHHDVICSTYLSFLTSGISCNNSLQKLDVPITLSDINHKEVEAFFTTISQKNKLTKLYVYFKLDHFDVLDLSDLEKKTKLIYLFYHQGLSLIANMLQRHTTMEYLEILCVDIMINLPNDQEHIVSDDSPCSTIVIIKDTVTDSLPSFFHDSPDSTIVIEHFWNIVLNHPSLQWIKIRRTKPLIDTYEQHQQQQQRPLPVYFV